MFEALDTKIILHVVQSGGRLSSDGVISTFLEYSPFTLKMHFFSFCLFRPLTEAGPFQFLLFRGLVLVLVMIYLLAENSPLFRWFIGFIGGAHSFSLHKSTMPTGRIGIFPI